MYYQHLDVDKVSFYLNDISLQEIVEQRFKQYTGKFRIKNGVIETYCRPTGSVIPNWHPHEDQSYEHFKKVGKVYNLLNLLDECMKECRGG